MPADGATSVKAPRSRCVVWHAPGTEIPADLTTSLQRREVEVTSCTTRFAALAKACLLERENEERTDDPEKRDALVLLLVAPAGLEESGVVVDAMKRYAPRTACWWYDPEANPKLRAVVDDDMDAWNEARTRTHAAPAKAEGVIRPGPARPNVKLRLTPEDPGSMLGPDAGPTSGASHTRMEHPRNGANRGSGS